MIYQQNDRHLKYRQYPLSSHIDVFEPTKETKPTRLIVHNGVPCCRLCSLHNHRAVELILMLEGAVWAHTSEGDFEMCEGDIMAVNPFEVHQLVSKDITCKVRYLVINFDCSLLKSRGSTLLDEIADGLETSRYRIAQSIPANAPCADQLCQHMKRLYDIYISETYDTPASTLAIYAEIFLLFSKLCDGGYFGESTKEGMSREVAFSQRVVQYVSEHYAEPLTTSAVSDYLHFNKSYFCRLFRQVFGESFQEYLNGFRISVAKSLPLSEYRTLSSIAEAVGYVNYTVFAKNFKELTGISPREYFRALS